MIPKAIIMMGFGESFEFKLDNYIPHIKAEITLNNGEVQQGGLLRQYRCRYNYGFQYKVCTKERYHK